jgi:hypothetical protein
MLEEATTSETSVNFQHPTRRYNQADSHIHTLYRENFKSHNISVLFQQKRQLNVTEERNNSTKDCHQTKN